MFWDKKEEEGLPDLPASKMRPSVKDLASMNSEERPHELPSFPDSPMSRGFSQSAIKEAVSPQEDSELPEFREPVQNKRRFVEMEEWDSEESPQTFPDRAPQFPSNPISRAPSEITKKEPIFVRLDKFQSAKDSIDEIYDKVGEIEKTLKEIRQIKQKEEVELHEWEKEVNLIKSRISSINSDIFEKI